MRKTIYILSTLFVLGLFAGCGSSSKGEGGSGLAKQLHGEWVLSSWNSNTPREFEAYLVFNTNNTFEIYQRVEQPYFQKYTGSYLLKKEVLSGTYTVRTAWGSTYLIEINESGNTLTMTSETSVSESAVYTRTTVPSSVKDNATAMQSVRSGSFRLL